MHTAVYLPDNHPGARKTCRDCGYYVFGTDTQQGFNCKHPSNVSRDVDIITGEKRYYLTNTEMRSEEHPSLCGPFGKYWIKHSTLYAIHYGEEAPKVAKAKNKIGIDDI